MPQSLRNKQPIELRTKTGLITEASLLEFPEGATVDEQNFVLNRKGERNRRLGIDVEDLGTLVNTGLSAAAIQAARYTQYLWEGADEDAGVSLVVVGLGSTLWFFDGGAENTSGSPKNSGNSVTLPGGTGIALQYAAVAGDLFITNGSQSVHVLSYNQTTDTITQSSERLSIRDQFGVDDGLELDEQPSTLSNLHNYNLRNQGWPTLWNVATVGDVYPPEGYNTAQGSYPSNSQIWHLGLLFDADDNRNRFVSRELTESTGEAPKGHYIIDAFNRGASRASKAAEETAGYTGTPNFPDDQSTGGLVGIAAYAGRVWYAVSGGENDGDDNSPYLSTFVLYSQLVDSKTDATKCYSQNDPTDKDLSDVIATDGGFIRLPEARNIHSLIPLQDSLVVLTENGVWQVAGGDAGFSATDQKVTKVSNSGAVGPSSVVDAEGSVFYFGESGIYAVQPDQTSLNLVPQNITENTIQAFFDAIPSVSRQEAKGYFDADLRTVRWLYNSGETWYNGSDWKNRFNKELVLDLSLPAWYPNVIVDDGTTSSAILGGYVETQNYISNVSTEDVVDSSGVTVTTSAAEDVTIARTSRATASTRSKYLTIQWNSTDSRYDFGFAFYRNASFRDWPSLNNLDANAFAVTGYATFGDTQRKKQSNYLTVHCRRTETGFETSGSELIYLNPSSCKVQSQWDWTTSAAAGRWGSEFQAYRYLQTYVPSGTADTLDYSYSIITTKNKLRGSGRALSLKFSSEPDKDLQILGWAMDMTSTQEQ